MDSKDQKEPPSSKQPPRQPQQQQQRSDNKPASTNKSANNGGNNRNAERRTQNQKSDAPQNKESTTIYVRAQTASSTNTEAPSSSTSTTTSTAVNGEWIQPQAPKQNPRNRPNQTAQGEKPPQKERTQQQQPRQDRPPKKEKDPSNPENPDRPQTQNKPRRENKPKEPRPQGEKQAKEGSTQVKESHKPSAEEQKQPFEGGEGNKRKRNNRGKGPRTETEQKTPSELNLQKKESTASKKESKNADLRRKQQMGEQSSDDDDQAQDGDDNDMIVFDISKVSQSTLRETLIRSLKKKKIDCPICYDKIGVRSSMWSCVQCYHPFHLECMKKWIHNSNKDKKQQTLLLNWSCPNCQYIYSDKMPVYTCYCGKFRNPEFDPYINPHGCENICGKKRGVNCRHPCDVPCHPGPCPPCTLKGGVIACYCKKKKREVFCSDSMTAFECGGACGKKLNCDKHFCDRNCHAGDCNKCTEPIEAVCHCGAESKPALCGEGEFACKRVCNKVLSCGNHKCLKRCHAGPCNECMLGPDDVDSCPCGKISLLTLTGGNFRESCADPIPVCGGPCKKIGACGHACKRSCHEGPCPPCKEPVEEVCRCKFTNHIVECFTINSPDHVEYICDRVCKKLKSCNVHPCNTPCCPARKGNDPNGVHLCLRVCGKPVNCGKHTCELFCHLGLCGKCPMKINEPLHCECGKTKLAPPQPCGTKPPECHEPCSRRMKECGHPCHLECHVDDCPPCEEKVSKTCHCGRSVVADVSCSKDALCTIPCNKIMSCGHKCETPCHTGDCPKDNPASGCGQKCSRPRQFCDHTCFQICHGAVECPSEPCKVEVVVRCKCGEREAFVECGSHDMCVERSLPCDALCKNLVRFSRFHDRNKIYFSALLIRYARANLVQLQKLEKRIEQFIKQSDTDELIYPFENHTQKKLQVQCLLAKHYHLNVSYYNHPKLPYFVIHKTSHMTIPKVLLSEYLKKVEKGEIKPDLLPFELSFRFLSSNKDDANQEQLRTILRDFTKDYLIDIEDRSLIIHFWEKQRAEMAQKKLWKSGTVYSSFNAEINERLVKEENSLQNAPNDVVRTKRRQLQPANAKQELPQHSDDEGESNTDKKSGSTASAHESGYISPEVKAQRKHFESRATLLEMCSAQEIEERTQRGLIDIFEQDPRTSTQNSIRGVAKWMVKSYIRASTETSDPSNIRPPDVLLSTTKYIMTKILDANFYVNVPFKYPVDKQNQSRSHELADILAFAFDRVKAITQDITILNEPTEQTAYALEIIARFYAVCCYEAQTIGKQSSQQFCVVKIANDFDAVLNQLLSMYTQLPEYKYEETKIEIKTLVILLHARDEKYISSFLATLDANAEQHTKIQHALEIVDAVRNLDYFNFFTKVKSLNYLELCVAFRHFEHIRSEAVQAMKKSRLPLTIEQFQSLLFFDSKQAAMEYLVSFGLSVANLNAPVEYETDPEDNQDEEEKKDNTQSTGPSEAKIEAPLVEKTTDLPTQVESSAQTNELEKQEIPVEEKKKRYREKVVLINWKVVDPSKSESRTALAELNSLITVKKTVEYYPYYKQLKSTNNDQIVTRAYLVLGNAKTVSTPNTQQQQHHHHHHPHHHPHLQEATIISRAPPASSK